MLKVDAIHVYYDAIHALKGVSFSVARGELGHATRRQWRGQDDDVENSLRSAPATTAAR